jgi:translocation and assembly module TamA
MSLPRRLPAWLAACVAALLLCGCGLLPGKKKEQEAAPAAPLVRLEVEAPQPLKALLENNLDLARLPRLAGTETIDDTELARLVAATPAQARQLAETEGYFRAVVQVRREGDGPVPTVRVLVQPGPRTHVDKLTFDVQGDLERRASSGERRAQNVVRSVQNAWPLQPGAPFRNTQWSNAKANALAQLRAEGYATATWSGTGAQVDAENDTARLFVVADSGPLFLAGPLVIEGLQRQDEKTVRNLANFGPGRPLTDQLLLDYQERLQAAGLYDSASVTLDPDPEQAEHARVLVKVHEMPLQQATVGVGYSTQAGPRVSLEHWHRRLFNQRLTARTKIEYGRDRQAVEGDISTHAQADLWRNLVGYSLSKEKTSDDTVTAARLRFGRARDTQRRQQLYFVETTHAERTTVDTRERQQALSLNANLGWRRVDSVVLPTDGWSLTLENGVGRARDQTGAAGGFLRLLARLNAFKPLGGGFYGQARVEFGQVKTANDVQVPDPLRFRAGGDESVRGYGYRELAPTGIDGKLRGGNLLFTTSVEAARPVSPKLPSVWWAVFVDAGRAADHFSDLKPAVGVGAGLRVRSPIGPIKLDLAYGEEVKRFRLHLSVGMVF